METNQPRRYDRFMAKAETYLHKYKSSHSASTTGTPAPATNGGDSNNNVITDRHLEILKKAQAYLHKKNKKDKKDDDDDDHKKGKKDGDSDDDKDDHKEHLKLAHAILKKIKKHKGGGHGKGSTNEEEEEEEEVEEEEEYDLEDEEEGGGWFTELVEGIQQLLEE